MGQRKNSKNARKLSNNYDAILAQGKEMQKAKAAKEMKDVDLFAVNVQKGVGVKRQREKLAAARFKDKVRSRGPTEETLLKKLAKKNPHSHPAKRDYDELMDLWGETGNETTPAVVQKEMTVQTKEKINFKKFSATAMPRVKALILPEGGQSFNPSAGDHQKTLKKVAVKQAADIEKELKNSLKYQIERARQGARADDIDEINANEESDDDDEEEVEDSMSDSDREELTHKAVDREKKLTKVQRLKREAGVKNKLAELAAKAQKKFERQFNALDSFIGNDRKDTYKAKLKEERLIKEKKDELDQQEGTGRIGKPSWTGRFKYKMRETDFQLEDELAGSLRQLKSTGTSTMLREKQDDAFRRNLIEMDAPTIGEKKRQDKAKYKIKARATGQAYKTLSQKLTKKTQQQKQINDDLENRQMMMNNDMIFI